MIIYYNDYCQFKLTDEEFKKTLTAFNSGKNVWVERLQVHLSPYYKWAGQKPPSQTEGILHDGTPVVKIMGQWRIKGQEDIKLDGRYYPEIANDTVNSQEEYKLLKNV